MIRQIAWMCVVLAATAAQAQEAQRLQYRADAQLEKSLGVYAEVRVRAEPSPPAGVVLPKFAGDRPLFAKWITPRVPAGHLWLALDQSGKQGVYDRLYVDTNANGSLADETPVAAEQAAAATDPNAPVSYGRKLNQQTARFAAVKILFPGKDGPIAGQVSAIPGHQAIRYDAEKPFLRSQPCTKNRSRKATSGDGGGPAGGSGPRHGDGRPGTAAGALGDSGRETGYFRTHW